MPVQRGPKDYRGAVDLALEGWGLLSKSTASLDTLVPLLSRIEGNEKQRAADRRRVLGEWAARAQGRWNFSEPLQGAEVNWALSEALRGVAEEADPLRWLPGDRDWEVTQRTEPFSGWGLLAANEILLLVSLGIPRSTAQQIVQDAIPAGLPSPRSSRWGYLVVNLDRYVAESVSLRVTLTALSSLHQVEARWDSHAPDWAKKLRGLLKRIQATEVLACADVIAGLSSHHAAQVLGVCSPMASAVVSADAEAAADSLHQAAMLWSGAG